MNFQQAVRNVFSNYATFNGRARRAEYWWWILFVILAALIVGILDSALFGGMHTMRDNGPLSAILSVALLLPGLAVGSRRLHDIDRSGWWLLIGLIPLVGTILLIWWFCTRGTAGPNRFGTDPLSSP